MKHTLMVFILLLVGCGGGGSSGSGSDSSEFIPLERSSEIQSQYASGSRPVIRILCLGSSVGAGAGLTDTNDTPVAYFTRKLIEAGYDAQFTNLSVNGSVVTDGAKLFPSLTAHYDIVLIVYGMNDGMPYQYHSGQIFNGFKKQVDALAMAIYQRGADPVFITTPHPHTQRAEWIMPPNPQIAWSGPDYICSPCYSIRHKNINDYLRSSPYPVIDAEKYWLDAVEMFGEDYLFDDGEIKHPNLTGHQLSFWLAIDEWLGTHFD